MDHLMWECSLSRSLWIKALYRLGMHRLQATSLNEVNNQIMLCTHQRHTAKGLYSRIARSFCTVVSGIWLEQNCRIFDDGHTPKDAGLLWTEVAGLDP